MSLVTSRKHLPLLVGCAAIAALVALTIASPAGGTRLMSDGRTHAAAAAVPGAAAVEQPTPATLAGGRTEPLSPAVAAQLQYAFAHWDDYNTAQYGDFNAWGGDCMNFVSQTLVARGWTPTAEWFNDAQEDWAPAFVHVPSFDAWLSEHPEYGATRLGLDQRDQVKVGDVVVFDWDGDGSLDHAQVVSRVLTDADGDVEILMVGHNVDSTYRSLDAAFDEQGQAGATAYFWSIP